MAVSIVFVLMNMTGDPVRLMLPPEATEEAIALVRESMGLDKPMIVRYFIFLSNIVQGDFGMSLAWKGRSALNVVLGRMSATISLSLISIGWSSVLALILGMISAKRQGGLLDRGFGIVTLLGQTAPSFWVGLMLIIIFSVRLKSLPPTGYGTWQHYIMPAFVMGLNPLARNTRFVRSCMLETLSQDYITTARAKGIPSRYILYKHALRNAAIPLITQFGQMLPGVLGGSAIIETVFAWPGVGYLLVESIGMRDFPVVQCSVCFIAIMFVIINIVIDLFYGVLDPRIKMSEE
jgi:ABC-type dipeptide/oligopeptide/nickel transport system permease component